MAGIDILKSVFYFDDDDEYYQEYNIHFEYKQKKFIVIYAFAESGAWNYRTIGYEPKWFQRLNKGNKELISFEETPFSETELIEAAELLIFSGMDELCYRDDEDYRDREAEVIKKEMIQKNNRSTQSTKRIERSGLKDFMDASEFKFERQANIEIDSKDVKWVYCPWCHKKHFPVNDGAAIRGLQYQCRNSNCKKVFIVDVG